MKRKLFGAPASYNFLENSKEDADRTFAFRDAHLEVANREQITLHNHRDGRVRLGFLYTKWTEVKTSGSVMIYGTKM